VRASSKTRRFLLWMVLCFVGSSAMVGCSGKCVADRPPLVQIGGTTYLADTSRSATIEDLPDSPEFTVETPTYDRIDRCDWKAQEGDTNLPAGTNVYKMAGDLYVAKLADRLIVLVPEN
jgi:hypothetical protein